MDIDWKPVGEYTTQVPDTYLLLVELSYGESVPLIVRVADNEDEEDCLVFDTGGELWTGDWGYITHFAILTMP